jgi:hypothetical protein
VVNPAQSIPGSKVDLGRKYQVLARTGLSWRPTLIHSHLVALVIILWLHRYKSNPADLKLTQFQIGFAVPKNYCRTLTF